jgi:hypothetical protein
MKKTITSMLLALAIALSASAISAKEVNSHLIVKLEAIADMPMMKIAQSDVPDNMLSLLTALRASTAYVGLMSKESSDPMMSIRAEAQSLAEWIKANPKERNLLDNIDYIDLQGALDSVLKTIR